jgi:hypothetical protein
LFYSKVFKGRDFDLGSLAGSTSSGGPLELGNNQKSFRPAKKQQKNNPTFGQFKRII